MLIPVACGLTGASALVFIVAIWLLRFTVWQSVRLVAGGFVIASAFLVRLWLYGRPKKLSLVRWLVLLLGLPGAMLVFSRPGLAAASKEIAFWLVLLAYICVFCVGRGQQVDEPQRGSGGVPG